eukprot:scaffold1222_cov330-Prasinococcus_capsulatus_cf.AAC.4
MVEDQPTFYELLAVQKLHESLRRAFKYCLGVAAQRHPQVALGRARGPATAWWPPRARTEQCLRCRACAREPRLIVSCRRAAGAPPAGPL